MPEVDSLPACSQTAVTSQDTPDNNQPSKSSNVVPEQQFSGNLNLKSDMQEMTTQLLKCQFCSEVVTGILKLNKHLKNVHKAKILITCNICGQKFKRNKELVKHLKQHHDSESQLPQAKNGKDGEKRKKRKKEKKREGKKSKSKTEKKLPRKGSMSSRVPPQLECLQLNLPSSSPPQNVNVSESTRFSDDPYDGFARGAETEAMLDDGWGDWDADFPPVSNDIAEISSLSAPVFIPGSSIENLNFESHVSMFTPEVNLSPSDFEYKLFSQPLMTDFSLQNQAEIVQCSLCNLIFKTREHAKIHSSYHTLKVNANFRCSSCDMNFITTGEYQTHIVSSRKCMLRKSSHNARSADSLSSTRLGVDHQIDSVRPELNIKVELREGEEEEVENDVFDPDNYRARGIASQRNSRRKLVACPVCKKSLRGKSYLDLHMVTHTKEKKFKCSECPKIFSAHSSSIRHFKTTHDPDAVEKKFYCKLCSRSYRTSLDLRNHVRYHNRQGKYSCKECGRKFNCSSHVTAHMRVHLQLTDLPFKCSKCCKSFMQNCELTRHEKIHLRPVKIKKLKFDSSSCKKGRQMKKPTEKSLLCPHCGKSYSQRKNLNLHLPSHPEFTGHICTRCGKELSSKEQLEIHMKEHPPKDEGVVICEICGKNYVSQHNLRAHMERHSSLTFQCDVCGKMCKTKNDLKFHGYTHMSTKPFGCKFCDYRCTQPSLVQNHVLTYHFSSDGFQENDKYGKERTFICQVCSEGFTNAACLTQHEHYHRDKKIKCKKPDCEELFHTKYDLQYHAKLAHRKKYQCQDCNKEYPGQAVLDLHRRYAHTGETPFACHFCDKKFKAKGDLTYHIATHTGDYKFTCEVCGKKCITKGNMKAHMKTHKSYCCNKCGTSCMSSSALKTHRCGSIVERTEEDSSSEVPYQLCIFCHKNFTVVDLQDHMREHHLDQWKSMNTSSDVDKEGTLASGTPAALYSNWNFN